jgi:hypothetical protein
MESESTMTALVTISSDTAPDQQVSPEDALLEMLRMLMLHTAHAEAVQFSPNNARIDFVPADAVARSFSGPVLVIVNLLLPHLRAFREWEKTLEKKEEQVALSSTTIEGYQRAMIALTLIVNRKIDAAELDGLNECSPAQYAMLARLLLVDGASFSYAQKLAFSSQEATRPSLM